MFINYCDKINELNHVGGSLAIEASYYMVHLYDNLVINTWTVLGYHTHTTI